MSVWQHIAVAVCYIVLFSLIVLCKCFPRLIEVPNETGFDYIGAIVGILSFLVAILAIMFGYNILDFQRRVTQEVDKRMSSVKDECLIETYSNSILESDSMMKYYLDNKKWDEILILKKINMQRELLLSDLSSSYKIKIEGTLQITDELIKNSNTFNNNTHTNYVAYMEVFRRLEKVSDKVLVLYNVYKEKDKNRASCSVIVPQEFVNNE